MADNARLFLKLDGPTGQIRGESRVASLRDWIEIDDWDWKLDPSSNRDEREAVRPSVLSFSKQMDRASTGMLQAMQKGDLLSASIRMDDASLRLFDLGVALEKVRVLSYEMRTESSDKRLSVEERWSIDYDAVVFRYRPDADAGTMEVRLQRPPGSPTAVPDDKARMFKEMTGDLSMQELTPVWDRIKELRAGRATDRSAAGKDDDDGPR